MHQHHDGCPKRGSREDSALRHIFLQRFAWSRYLLGVKFSNGLCSITIIRLLHHGGHENKAALLHFHLTTVFYNNVFPNFK